MKKETDECKQELHSSASKHFNAYCVALVDDDQSRFFVKKGQNLNFLRVKLFELHETRISIERIHQ